MSLPESVLEGKYRVVRKISEGGMGLVYLVRHLHLDQYRVIKVIRRQYAQDTELQQRFLREARTAITLRHPKIAEIYDFAVTDDGTAFIVMEFIDGRTLKDLLEESGPPPVPLILEVAVQTLEGLDYLHRKGFVHRDIAPDNIMLTRNFEGAPAVKLIDLGIAKRVDQDASMRLTGTGMFVGKALYSSPEQFGQGEVEARSDLYSFGVVLYELLTGRCPLLGQTLSELITAHLMKPPVPFEDSDPAGRVPPELRRIVAHALEKRCDERMDSAQSFIELLRPLRDAYDAATVARDLDRTLHLPRVSLLDEDPEATEPLDAQAMALSNARKLMGDGRHEEARQELRRVLDAEPRHAAAQRLLDELEALAEAPAPPKALRLSTAATVSTPAGSIPGLPAAPPSRRRWPWLAAAVVLAAAVAVALQVGLPRDTAELPRTAPGSLIAGGPTEPAATGEAIGPTAAAPPPGTTSAPPPAGLQDTPSTASPPTPTAQSAPPPPPPTEVSPPPPASEPPPPTSNPTPSPPPTSPPPTQQSPPPTQPPPPPPTEVSLPPPPIEEAPPPPPPPPPLTTEPETTPPAIDPAASVETPSSALPPVAPPTIETINYVPPELVDRELKLRYPRTALRRKIEARVTVLVTVDEAGKAVYAEIQGETVVSQGGESLKPDFEAAAVDAVLSAKYKPGTRNGEPSTEFLTVPVTFSLSR